MTHTRIFNIWSSMKQRCFYRKHKSYGDYGGRGITVCHRWLKFENFLADMGEPPPGLTLERKNNDDGYHPGNCRWASQKDQRNNTRSNHRLVIDGVEKTLAQWREHYGIVNYYTLHYRLTQGWPALLALTTPATTNRRRPISLETAVIWHKNQKRPTRKEMARIERMKLHGCVICGGPGEVHHIVEANKRLGHWYSFMLCAGHHRGQWDPNFEYSKRVALSDGSKLFVEAFGSEKSLWEATQRRLGLPCNWPESKIVPRRISNLTDWC